MLSKIPEEIFCGVFYSPPVLLDAFPQPPSFTSYGDQTLEWSKIHPTMVCLIESTNTCENAFIISTKGKGLKIVHFVFLFFQNLSQSAFLHFICTCKQAVVSPRHVVVEHAGAEPQFLGVQVSLANTFVLREYQRLA